MAPTIYLKTFFLSGLSLLEFVATNCKFYFALCIQALSKKVDFGSYMHVRFQ